MVSKPEDSPKSRNSTSKSLDRYSKRAEEILFAFLLVVIIGLGLTPLVLRNFFQSGGVTWTEPLIRQMVLWIALLGAGAATVDKKHIAIDVLSHFLSERFRRIMAVLTGLFSTLICGILTWVSIKFVKNEAQFSSPSSASSNIPEWVFELALPIGFLLLTFRLLIVVIEDLFVVIRDFGKSQYL